MKKISVQFILIFMFSVSNLLAMPTGINVSDTSYVEFSKSLDEDEVDHLVSVLWNEGGDTYETSILHYLKNDIFKYEGNTFKILSWVDTEYKEKFSELDTEIYLTAKISKYIPFSTNGASLEYYFEFSNSAIPHKRAKKYVRKILENLTVEFSFIGVLLK